MNSDPGNVVIQWTMYGSITEPLFLLGISLVGLYLLIRRCHWKFLFVFFGPLWSLFFHFIYPIQISYHGGLDPDGEFWQDFKNGFLIALPSAGNFFLLLYFVVDALGLENKSNKVVDPTGETPGDQH